MVKLLSGVALLVGVAWALGTFSESPGGTAKIGFDARSAGNLCAVKSVDLAAYLTKAESLGFIRIGRGYQVDERPWEALEHDQKVNLALAAFCRDAGGGGRATTLLRGLHDGKVKASVVDGNYFDG